VVVIAERIDRVGEEIVQFALRLEVGDDVVDRTDRPMVESWTAWYPAPVLRSGAVPEPTAVTNV
jgi:hypothetical protein